MEQLRVRVGKTDETCYQGMIDEETPIYVDDGVKIEWIHKYSGKRVITVAEPCHVGVKSSSAVWLWAEPPAPPSLYEALGTLVRAIGTAEYVHIDKEDLEAAQQALAQAEGEK